LKDSGYLEGQPLAGFAAPAQVWNWQILLQKSLWPLAARGQQPGMPAIDSSIKDHPMS
jgi:hypothetical protein